MDTLDMHVHNYRCQVPRISPWKRWTRTQHNFALKLFQFLGHYQNKTAVKTSVANVRLLMPLAIIMLCFRSKSISVIVVSIMNFTSKLAYLYKLTDRRKDLIICMHLLLFRTSRKKKIDSS